MVFSSLSPSPSQSSSSPIGSSSSSASTHTPNSKLIDIERVESQSRAHQDEEGEGEVEQEGERQGETCNTTKFAIYRIMVGIVILILGVAWFYSQNQSNMMYLSEHVRSSTSDRPHDIVGRQVSTQYPPLFPTSRRVAAVIPISVHDIPAHMLAMSTQWFEEMAADVLVFYLISREAEAEGWKQIPPYLRGLVHMLAVDSGDREYPPIKKELYYLPRLAELYGELDAVLKFDSDTYIDPVRLQRYIQFMLTQTEKDNKPIFAGRPIHHCHCHPDGQRLDAKRECTAELGVTYCSGAFYILNSPAIKSYIGNMEQCLSPPPTWINTSHCSTSDTRFGACHNLVGTICTPMNMFDEPDPKAVSPRRKGWGRPINARGQRAQEATQLCQVAGIHGGIADRRFGEVYTFSSQDWEKCLAYHPLKMKEDMRYARFVVGISEDPYKSWMESLHSRASATVVNSGADYSIAGSISTNPATPADVGRCRIGIGVLSHCSRSSARDSIRATWARVADAIGTVSIHFVIDERECADPSTRITLRREMLASRNDIVLIKEESSLMSKSIGWLKWAKQKTYCEVFFQVDDHSYVRIMTLLNFVVRQFGSVDTPNRFFFGFRSIDPSTSRFPLTAFGLSRDIVNDVLEKDAALAKQMDEYTRINGDPPQVLATAVEAINKEKEASHTTAEPSIRLYSGDEYDPRKCVGRTIVDRYGWHPNFNIYQRFRADLAGTFCERTSGQSDNDDMFAFGRAGSSDGSSQLKAPTATAAAPCNGSALNCSAVSNTRQG